MNEEKKPPARNGSRTRRYVLTAIVFLLLALILANIFLHHTSVGSEKFVRNTLLLWTGTVVVILALLILATVLGRNLVKLYFERRGGQVGSRFRTTLVGTFVALSLLPALLLFLLAYGLINISVEQWFSAPTVQMLEYSRAIGVQYYEEAQRRSIHFATRIASEFADETTLLPNLLATTEGRLTERLREYGLDGARVLNLRGDRVLEAGSIVSGASHQVEIARLVAQARAGNTGFQVERLTPGDALKEVVWTTVPLRDGTDKIFGVLFTESFIPQSAHFKAYSVIEAYEKYGEFQKQKATVRFNFLLMMALSTLLVVFVFSWFALYLAKRITGPIQALAEGAASVAAGNLDYRVRSDAFDELKELVESFNRMTAELQENKTNIETAQNSLRQTNFELDDRRRYIETILQTIATGVMSLDSNYRVRTMNRAASQMLEVQWNGSDGRLEEVVQSPACDTLRMLLHKSAVLGSVVRNIELALPSKTLQLAATVTPLVDAGGQRSGWVLVLDDVTEILRGEKMAAWQEVARRLAHEIKNPLTPIQLSAERILKRYRQVMEAARPHQAGEWITEFKAFDNVLEECIRAISQEAGSLKNLVDEFSLFARLPVARLEENDLHRVLEGALNLYNGRLQDVRLVKAYDVEIPPFRLDSEQMKRVFVNLFDNALEAMADGAQAKVLQIRTSRNPLQKSVRVEVSDTGCGFPREYQDSLFLPYFSTRKDGTGLGLAIVRQIISDHHGRVHAEANVPVGARIVIDLPLA